MINHLYGVWALPRTVSGNRCHFVESGASWCLCLRWHRDQLLMRDGEPRLPLPHVDAKSCVSAYTKRTQPDKRPRKTHRTDS